MGRKSKGKGKSFYLACDVSVVSPEVVSGWKVAGASANR